MSLTIELTNRFNKDYKKCIRRGLDISKLDNVIGLLKEQIPLPYNNQDHMLVGDLDGYRECHIQPDWLLIYLIDLENMVVTLYRTGTHSDLFD